MPERFMKAGFSAVKIDNVLDYFSKTDTPFKYPDDMGAEYDRSRRYYQTDFLEEVNKNISPNDELYEMFEDMTKPAENYDKILDMINNNNLYH